MKRASSCDLLLGEGLLLIILNYNKYLEFSVQLQVVNLAVQIVETVWTGRLTVKTGKQMTSLLLYVQLFDEFILKIFGWISSLRNVPYANI